MQRHILPRSFFTYIATNNRNTVLYTGVTNNLKRRMNQHMDKKFSGFTSRYNVCKLVYFERYQSVLDAIAREKQIKGGSREDKIRLISKDNPNFKDLLATDGIASSSRWQSGLLAMTEEEAGRG